MTSIDLKPLQLQKAISQRIASIRREQNKPNQNPLIREILEKDLAELQKGMASIK